MITSRTVKPHQATSIEEMQTIVHNQITAKIMELEERVARLKNLQPAVEGVVDWASYERAIADVEEYGDAKDLTALHALGEYHGDMKAGSYF